MYQLKRVQVLKTTLPECWKFFTDPQNLQQITPPYMGFVITSEVQSKIYPGQIITYKVSPVLSFPLTWVTEISQAKENEYFIDEQRFGPYSFWHHKHFFKEVEGGVEMIDVVDYKIPFGIFGRLLFALFIKKKLEEIFNYRYQILEIIFNEKVK